jgi:O-antigen ligase
MRSRVPSEALEGLLFVLAVFGPLAFGCVEPWSRAMLEILAFSAALLCFLRGGEAATPFAGAAWVFPAAVALLGCAQVYSFTPADLPRPIGPFTSAPNLTKDAVQLWSAYAAILYVVPRTITTPSGARRFCWVVFGVGLAVATLGLLQSATGSDLIYWFRATPPDYPPFGPYYNRDHAANFLLMSLATGGGLLIGRVKQWSAVEGPKRGELKAACLHAAGLAALLAAVLFCGSRGAVLAMVLGSGFVLLAGAGFIKRASARRGALAAALAGAAVAVACAFAYVHAGGANGAPMDRSVSTRMMIYEDCFRWLRDAPLFGTGLGSFTTVYPSYQDQSLRALVPHAHSDWLEFLLETGASGGAFALLACMAILSAALRTWRRSKSREMRALIGGALAATAAFAAHSLFEFSFQIPANAAQLSALIGFLVSAPAWADKEPRVPMSDPPRAGIAAAAAACFLLASWGAIVPAAAAWSAQRGTSRPELVEGLHWAFGQYDDPAIARGLATELYLIAAEGKFTEPSLLRASMAFALEAEARRPFDSGSLRLAGLTLARLRRPGDAGELYDRAGRVSFVPIEAPRRAASDAGREKLKTLSELGLLPLKDASR